MSGIQNQAINALKVIQNILVHKLTEQRTKFISHFEFLFDISYGFIGMSPLDNIINLWQDPVPYYAKGFCRNLPKSPVFSYKLFLIFFFFPWIICIPYMKYDSREYGLSLVLCCQFLGVVHKSS